MRTTRRERERNVRQTQGTSLGPEHTHPRLISAGGTHTKGKCKWSEKNRLSVQSSRLLRRGASSSISHGEKSGRLTGETGPDTGRKKNSSEMSVKWAGTHLPTHTHTLVCDSVGTCCFTSPNLRQASFNTSSLIHFACSIKADWGSAVGSPFQSCSLEPTHTPSSRSSCFQLCGRRSYDLMDSNVSAFSEIPLTNIFRASFPYPDFFFMSAESIVTRAE